MERLLFATVPGTLVFAKALDLPLLSKQERLILKVWLFRTQLSPIAATGYFSIILDTHRQQVTVWSPITHLLFLPVRTS